MRRFCGVSTTILYRVLQVTPHTAGVASRQTVGNGAEVYERNCPHEKSPCSETLVRMNRTFAAGIAYPMTTVICQGRCHVDDETRRK